MFMSITFLFIVRNKNVKSPLSLPTVISECFLKHSINAFTSFLYKRIIVLLFSLKYRFGGQHVLFVFTMALMSSDVIRL